MFRVKNNTIPEVYSTKLQNNGGARQSENNFEESNLLNSNRFGIFWISILKFIWPKPSHSFNCSNLKSIRFIIQLHLEVSHLHEVNSDTIFKIA